jgi:uncharacterized zinc-type alcohol dehydrogenase-like protein
VVRRDLGPSDVLVDIAFVGICHSDIHEVRGEWGQGLFPMVPGHEITGVVSAVGGEVRRCAVGDRVGVGCIVDSCRTCSPCLAGEEQYCLRGYVETYDSHLYTGEPTYGGYSTAIVVDEAFVLHVPATLGLEEAAPLLCAGITTYAPLQRAQVGAGSRVGVVGMGGLGHLGVRIAAALGAEVTVLSRTLDKQDDSRRLGASEHVATGDPAALERLAGRFDLLLNTVSADVDLDALLSLLALDGSLVLVGLPERPQSFTAFGLVSARRSISGSNIGGIRQTQEALDFCAEHGLGAAVEVIGADEVDAAFDRVVRGDVRYRFVVDAATIGSPATSG